MYALGGLIAQAMNAQAAIAARFLAVALALFVFAALVIVVASMRRGPTVARRLMAAYLIEFAVLAVVIVPAYLGTIPLLITVLVICGIGTWELYHTLARAAGPQLTGIGILAGMALPLAAGLASQSVLFNILLLTAAVQLAVGLVIQTSGSLTGTAAALGPVGLIYPNAFGACLLLIGRGEAGFGLVAFLVGVVELNDSAAMLGGLLIGGRKISPRLSPNKTIAGSCAGLLAALGGAFLLAFAAPSLTLADVLAAGLVIGISAQLGDLVASAVKRAAGVKDFSTWVPVAGGVLDIYDGLIFAAAVFWLYLQVVGGA